jgi:hypothetical protein
LLHLPRSLWRSWRYGFGSLCGHSNRAPTIGVRSPAHWGRASNIPGPLVWGDWSLLKNPMVEGASALMAHPWPWPRRRRYQQQNRRRSAAEIPKQLQSLCQTMTSAPMNRHCRPSNSETVRPPQLYNARPVFPPSVQPAKGHRIPNILLCPGDNFEDKYTPGVCRADTHKCLGQL